MTPSILSILLTSVFTLPAFAHSLKIALPSYPTHLHYAVHPQPQARAINALVAETLVYKNPHTGLLDPRLASHVVTEKNNRVWILELDPTARFQDGESVKAKDILFSWDLIFAPSSKALALQELLKNWERPIDLGGGRVKFAAKEKRFGMLETLTEFYILSSKSHARSGHSRTQLVGSGPYVLTFVQDGTSLGARWNDQYWGLERPWSKDFPQSASIEFSVESDPKLAWEKMKLGQIDYLYVLSSNLWTHTILPEAPKNSFLQPIEFRSRQAGGVAVFLWNQRHPALSEKNIRCGLQGLMDRNFWTQKVFAKAYEPAMGLFPASSANHDAQIRPVEYNPRKAALMFERGGWQKGLDGIYTKNGMRLSFEMLLDNPAQERIAGIFQEELRNAGVEMSLRTLDWAAAKQRLAEHRFDAALVYRPDPGLERMEEEWGSQTASISPSLNRTGFKDPDVDRWLKTLRTTFSETKRHILFRNIEHRIAETCSVGFGWENSTTRLVVVKNGLSAGKSIPPFADWTQAFWVMKKPNDLVSRSKAK